MKSLKQYLKTENILSESKLKKGMILGFDKGQATITDIRSDLITLKKSWDNKEDDYIEGALLRGIKDGDVKIIKESVVNEDSKRKPYLLKNAKVGDVFRDGGDLSREYKITKVTPTKVYATCVKQPSTTAEYNRSSSEYNEPDLQYTSLFTVNESVVSEATMSDIPHEIDDQIHKLKDMRFDLEETLKNWELAGMDVTPLANVIIDINNLIDSMYKNGAQLADQEIAK